MINKRNKYPNVMVLHGHKAPGFLVKLSHSISHIRRIYWLEALAVMLAAYLTFLPSHTRQVFWMGVTKERDLVLLLLLFSLISVSLLWATGQRVDVWILMLFNMHGKRPLWLDWFMLAYTQFGNFIATIILALIIFLSISHLLAYALIFGTIVLWLAVEQIKLIIHRKRPYVKLKKIRIVGVKAGGRSFPSGHTSQAFFIATLLFHYFSPGIWVSLSLFLAAAMVGITRMYVGMHYPRDVMAGAMIGSVFGWISALLIFV